MRELLWVALEILRSSKQSTDWRACAAVNRLPTEKRHIVFKFFFKVSRDARKMKEM
jgi:hypothetical protein